MKASGMTTLRQSTCLLLTFALVAVTWPLNGGANQGDQSGGSAEQSAAKIPPDQIGRAHV